MRNHILARRVSPALLALGALLIAAAVTVPLVLVHHGHPTAAPTKPTPAPPTSPVAVPSGAIFLTQGTHPADGIEIGYPHTIIGAVSAASEYLDAATSTLDPDYAASIMRVAGDPANTALPSNLAASTVKLRAALQLPTTGPLDPPTAFQTTAQMYQLRDAEQDSVLVLLLTDSTFINARGGMAQTTGVFPMQMLWTGGDWKLHAIGRTGQDYSGLAATPDTQDAVGQGWLPLIAATGGMP